MLCSGEYPAMFPLLHPCFSTTTSSDLTSLSVLPVGSRDWPPVLCLPCQSQPRHVSSSTATTFPDPVTAGRPTFLDGVLDHLLTAVPSFPLDPVAIEPPRLLLILCPHCWTLNLHRLAEAVIPIGGAALLQTRTIAPVLQMDDSRTVTAGIIEQRQAYCSEPLTATSHLPQPSRA
ncbi:hypothetical protein M6B38_311810 [Iris pallida]|uniref:Uncharacterized protein n=1 Tax=Iris pallida TaxID=29817 RepID=A0AAX6HGN0_IRIPA|nr:hypothetical protein M6B38_311810 [Iris pallida]